MSSVVEQVALAQKAGTPLVQVATPDQPVFVERFAEILSAKTPLIEWDCVGGARGTNDLGIAVVVQAFGKGDGAPVAEDPLELLRKAVTLPPRTIIIVYNAQLLFDSGAGMVVTQGLANLRDQFKSDNRMVVLLAPWRAVPNTLRHDVITFEEELPTKAQIRGIVDQCVHDAQVAKDDIEVPDDDGRDRSAEALLGLASFQVEQAMTMALLTGKASTDDLWERKRPSIEAVRGLKMDRERVTFDMMGGCERIKHVTQGMFDGPEPPAIIVRCEEIEKVMAGVGSDTNGTADDALQVVLNGMEDNDWTGLIAVGPPGSGKSMFAKSLSWTYGRRSFSMDIGATRSKFQGDSEENIRSMVQTLFAIGQRRVYVVATCNGLETVKPELRRRFTDGIWYFDLPTDEERRPIVTLNLKKFGYDATPDVVDELVEMTPGWTGAEIRNLVRRAYRNRLSFDDAKQTVVPVCISSPESIEKLRRQADGRFLSASYGGHYQMPTPNVSNRQKGRNIDLGVN